MKKSVMFVMYAAAAFALHTAPAYAYESTATSMSVRVIINNNEVDKTIPLTDASKDGTLSVYDAMLTLHDSYYPGGSAAGYDANHVWGKTGTVSYDITDKDGKKVQNLSDGCTIKCTVTPASEASYTLEWEGWNASSTTYTEGTTIKLTAVEHPANQGAAKRVANVGILVDGKDTGIRTDSNGSASIKLSGAGSHTVKGDFSAFSKTSGQNSFAYTVKAAEAPVTTTTAASPAATTTTTTATTAAPAVTTAAATTAPAVSTTTAAAATTTAPAATTAKAAATTTKAVTTAAPASTTKTAATTKKADGTTQKAGSLQTGDALPVGGIATAGVLAIGTAIACACKRKENN
ncbi:MAG: hypothetical protein K5705_09665 [Oscillospiraceae bacterium]|nr:hypothetical protein [Oscillospiraceae bacterium]